MAAGTLFTYPENFRSYKALIAAQYSGAKVKVLSEPPAFSFGETNKTEEFLKKFPLGKVPAFEGEDGVKLFESNAIAYYVANGQLRGENVRDSAYIRQWVEFADSEILPASCTWVFPCMGIMQFNKQHTEKAKEDVKRALEVLNNHLETQTYLVGERITLADISVMCDLLQLYQLVLEPEFRQPFVNTNRWFNTMIHQPQVKAIIGEFKLCDKMAQFDAKKWQEFQGAQKGGAQKGAAKQDKKQQKKQQPKKEEKPKAKKPKEDDDDDDFDDVPREKTKDPFATMPKGTFVMDDWKKMYSNNDTLSVALPYFWEKFDSENYSIWFCEYLYPEDLKMTFMSSNLVGGMFQRLDKLRKHAFGSVMIFGENNASTISGVWIWRGHDLAFTLSPDMQVDYESYSWKKLEPNTEETKKLVTEYFAWEGDFGGKKVAEGKCFK